MIATSKVFVAVGHFSLSVSLRGFLSFFSSFSVESVFVILVG